MIDSHLWFTERELFFLPIHFVPAQTPCYAESLKWIRFTLSGRFIIMPTTTNRSMHGIPYFEDKNEALLYELRWG